ncbi:MAG: class I SAM-dependent methyltransferase [Candidatus Dormibacteria bacterium]
MARYAPPLLSQLVGDGTTVFYEAEDILEQLLPGQPSFEQIKVEHGELDAELGLRRRQMPAAPLYPDSFTVERQTSLFLYALTRRARPHHILETGVANGSSSFFFLHALRLNKHGTLHSVDLGQQVGALVHDDERSDWDLHILRAVRARADFVDYARRLPELDIFVHDSDHTRKWQRFEYGVALGQLRPQGFLTSDDVDSSWAFSDFCRLHRLSPYFLLDRRKVFGVARARG